MSVEYNYNILYARFLDYDQALSDLLEVLYDEPKYERRWVDDGINKHMESRKSLLRAVNRPHRKVIDEVNGEIYLRSKYDFYNQ